MNIEQFRQKQAELAKEIAEHGKSALLEGFKALFEAHPGLHAVRWKQYTPYFNDGEPCTFDVHDRRFRAEGLDPEGGDYDDGFHVRFSDYGMTEEQKIESRSARELLDRIKKSASALQGSELESVYLAAFGDHTQITVTRDLSVEVDEYEHE
jgi:hypothetical protein